MEKCIKCNKEMVINLQNGAFCKKHFIDYFEKKIRKTIRKYNMISKGNKVCLALSGGKDSLSLLHFMKDYTKDVGIELFVLFVDEGVKSKGLNLYEKLKEKYESENTTFYQVKFKDFFGFNLDNIIEKANKFKKKPCSFCGTLRRYVLNYFARKNRADVIITGHTLDDHAQAFLMNLIKGNLEKNFNMGPVSGLLKDKKFTKRAKPLYFLNEEEIKKYCEVQGIEIIKQPCDYSDTSQRGKIKKAINTLEVDFPATKNSIVKSFVGFLDTYKELLVLKNENNSKSKNTNETNIPSCKNCQEPTSEEICNTCKLVSKLGFSINKESIL